MTNSEVWIGLVEVKAELGNSSLGEAKGAFVNVLALASDQSDYLTLVHSAMAEYGFSVIGATDVARLDDWEQSNVVAPTLAQLVTALTAESPVQFGEFKSYREHDA